MEDNAKMCNNNEFDSSFKEVKDVVKIEEAETSVGAIKTQFDNILNIHMYEMGKLKKQLKASETEREMLLQNWKETQNAGKKKNDELQFLKSRFIQLKTHVQSLQHIHSQLPEQLNTSENTPDELNSVIMQYQYWSTMSGQKIDKIQESLTDLEQDFPISDSAKHLSTEFTNLLNKWVDTEKENFSLRSGVFILSKFATEASKSLESTQDDLKNMSDKFSKLHDQVCTVNGETLLRTITEHAGIVPESVENDLEYCRKIFQSEINVEDFKHLRKAETIRNSIQSIKDQIKNLSDAVERTIKLSNKKSAKIASLKAKVVNSTASLDDSVKKECNLREILKDYKAEVDKMLKDQLKNQ